MEESIMEQRKLKHFEHTDCQVLSQLLWIPWSEGNILGWKFPLPAASRMVYAWTSGKNHSGVSEDSVHLPDMFLFMDRAWGEANTYMRPRTNLRYLQGIFLFLTRPVVLENIIMVTVRCHASDTERKLGFGTFVTGTSLADDLVSWLSVKQLCRLWAPKHPRSAFSWTWPECR